MHLVSALDFKDHIFNNIIKKIKTDFFKKNFMQLEVLYQNHFTKKLLLKEYKKYGIVFPQSQKSEKL